MNYLLEGIVVAKSRKHGGNCVVILDENNRIIYRLVSDDPRRKDGELYDSECCDSNGVSIELRDKVKFYVKSLQAMSHDFQHENLALDTSKKFAIIEKNIDGNRIKNILEDYLCDEMFIFGNANIAITPEEVSKENSSFILARVSNLEFKTLENEYGIKCVCNFVYNDKLYKNMRVTISKEKEDDVRKYSGKAYSTAILGFSFGKPYDKDGLHYKFVCSFLTGIRR